MKKIINFFSKTQDKQQKQGDSRNLSLIQPGSTSTSIGTFGSGNGNANGDSVDHIYNDQLLISSHSDTSLNPQMITSTTTSGITLQTQLHHPNDTNQTPQITSSQIVVVNSAEQVQKRNEGHYYLKYIDKIQQLKIVLNTLFTAEQPYSCRQGKNEGEFRQGSNRLLDERHDHCVSGQTGNC